tara:strand:- start:933 stop:1664 length:732 start_codon:yes stop_codon:yes gene_type:complete
MEHLMQIEADFLSSAQVRSEVNFDTIFNLQSAVSDAKKTKFEKSLKLAKLVYKSVQWFNLESTKELLEENGIEWTNTEVFFETVFCWKKSFGYKMVKCGKLQEEQSNVVTKFKRKCTQTENSGEDAKRSVEALLKFAKAEENGEETQVAREKTYATFSISKDGVNGEKGYSMRLTDSGISINGEIAIEGDEFSNHLYHTFEIMRRMIEVASDDEISSSIVEEDESFQDVRFDELQEDRTTGIA